MITKFKPEGIRTLDAKWNNGIVRLTRNAQIIAVEDLGAVTYLVYEPELDEEFILANIELTVKPRNMQESQLDLFTWILEGYEDGVRITNEKQLETTFDKITDEFRKLGIIE